LRCTQRNKHRIWLCPYSGTQNIIDENGHDTGEKIQTYGQAIEVWANVSPATGQSGAEQFGNLENYDKVIVTNDLSCPIDENSVLFIDKEPSYTSVLTMNVSAASTLLGTSAITPVYVSVPVPDYTVRRVAKSLNSMSVAVRKVTVM